MYYRPDAGHAGGGFFVRWNWMRNFRRDRSFLVFTNRSNDDFSIVSGTGTGNGYMNSLMEHGWDPETIIDEINHYAVTLTGAGTADVTFRNLQRLAHTPGTVYDVTINGSPNGLCSWNAKGEASGIYIVRVIRDGKVLQKKISLIK